MKNYAQYLNINNDINPNHEILTKFTNFSEQEFNLIAGIVEDNEPLRELTMNDEPTRETGGATRYNQTFPAALNMPFGLPPTNFDLGVPTLGFDLGPPLSPTQGFNLPRNHYLFLKKFLNRLSQKVQNIYSKVY